MNSIDTRFSRNVFKPVQKTRMHIGLYPDITLLLVFLPHHHITTPFTIEYCRIFSHSLMMSWIGESSELYNKIKRESSLDKIH